ncbi:hypothetical protein KFK09_025688 [Dendrobium nobile]|uniref:EXPERA domain-containing protein n=1 Tax=Dendrobium nobile TaxID=94219 RepID=A0A8T3A4M2_DENNO|nr:hypothetical protein KFK09_025682 [Dendrobium nobile]KAI0491426.1 hypothetical protein KFK09_025686 [Dendrobium nobile]KAI0491428.1 hypothetical protein KFK09_025688 [Dendrobium nobile]
MASYEHPYSPRDLQLPGYVPLSLSQIDIVLPYIGSSVVVVAAIWLLSGRFPKLSKTDRLLMCWWAFSGLTHIILEGYFAFVPDFFKKKTPFYLDELCKYAIASRKSYSYILQFAICLGQLYGCMVYFVTSYLDGDNFATSPFYYWAYYIGANGVWVVMATPIAIRSWKKIISVFELGNKKKTK